LVDESAHEDHGALVGAQFVWVDEAAEEVQGILVDYRNVGHSAVHLEGVAAVAVLPAHDNTASKEMRSTEALALRRASRGSNSSLSSKPWVLSRDTWRHATVGMWGFGFVGGGDGFGARLHTRALGGIRGAR